MALYNIISFFAILKVAAIEKFVMYECGFTPREILRQLFNIHFHFYVIGISLFLSVSLFL